MSEQKKSLEEIFDGMPTAVSLSGANAEKAPGSGDDDPPARVSVGLQFSEKGFGFGEVSVVQTPEGTFLDTECMSLDRVKRYFAMLLDGAIPDTEMDPAKHALYNRVMGRRCNDRCGACSAAPKEEG